MGRRHLPALYLGRMDCRNRRGRGVKDVAIFRKDCFNLLGPKAAVFYVAVLLTFIVEGQPVLSQTITLTVAYVAVATVAAHAIVISGGFAGAALLKRPRTRAPGAARCRHCWPRSPWFAWSTAR